MVLTDSFGETRWIIINSNLVETDDGINPIITFTDIIENRKLEK